MLNANMNYPYPIIRDYLEDYVTTVFEGKLSVSLEKDGYYIINNHFFCENFILRGFYEV